MNYVSATQYQSTQSTANFTNSESMFALVQKYPGNKFAFYQEKSGLTKANTYYHLRQLAKSGQIGRYKSSDGGASIFYPYGVRPANPLYKPLKQKYRGKKIAQNKGTFTKNQISE